MGDYGRQANEIFAFATFKDGVNKIDPTDKNSLTHKVAEAYFNAYFKKNKDGKMVKILKLFIVSV